MSLLLSPPRMSMREFLPRAAVVLALLIAASALARGAQPKVAVLHIGSTGTLTGKIDSPKEKAGFETLKRFIKDETGLDNEIVGQLQWPELAAKMAKGEFQLGVFQGFEFAWAQQIQPELRPLAVGINVYRYPVACIFTRKDNPVKEFADLKGKALTQTLGGQEFPRLYVDRACQALGAKPDAFFSMIATSENLEDAIDDVVDGKAAATVLDQAAVDAYKRRKPGRFNQLKELTRSQPFPPLVIAHYGTHLDDVTLRRFKDGLLSASRKDKGEMLLTLSHLSGFETIPPDFSHVLEEMRKRYPKDGK